MFDMNFFTTVKFFGPTLELPSKTIIKSTAFSSHASLGGGFLHPPDFLLHRLAHAAYDNLPLFLLRRLARASAVEKAAIITKRSSIL
jgi:hypothetical protein